MTKKDFQSLLLNTNHRMDVFRNGIFNAVISMRFVKTDDIKISKSEVDKFNKLITDLENSLSSFISKLNLKIGDFK